MPYIIYKSDGTEITVDDNTLYEEFYDPEGGTPPPGGSTGFGSGIRLVGRNRLDYGTPIAQTFLQMTENFSSETGTQPKGPYSLEGQLWYDNTLDVLYVRVTPTGSTSIIGTDWYQVVTIPGTGPISVPVINPTGTPKNGDIQVLLSPTKISIWGGDVWNQIFPAIYS